VDGWNLDFEPNDVAFGEGIPMGASFTDVMVWKLGYSSSISYHRRRRDRVHLQRYNIDVWFSDVFHFLFAQEESVKGSGGEVLSGARQSRRSPDIFRRPIAMAR